MTVSVLRVVLPALVALAAWGCDADGFGPDRFDGDLIEVGVSGGLAGVDYGFQVSGAGSVVGMRCAAGCSFAPGDTLFRLTPAQRDALMGGVDRAEFPPAGSSRDYGTPCCDLPTFEVAYTTAGSTTTVAGTLETFPSGVRSLAESLHRIYQGTPPVIMAQDSGLGGFAADPMSLDEVRLEQGALAVDLHYGGGCSHHDVDAVVWTGWMESHPVQVGVALTHDDHDDMCDAMVHRSLRFDLDPLRRAYAAAYGPGPATVVLRVEAAGAGQQRLVTFTF